MLLAACWFSGPRPQGRARSLVTGSAAAEVVITAGPTGGLSLVTRARTALDGELFPVSRFSNAELVGAVLGLGLLSLAWSWWCLMRPDHWFASTFRAGQGVRRCPRRQGSQFPEPCVASPTGCSSVAFPHAGERLLLERAPLRWSPRVGVRALVR